MIKYFKFFKCWLKGYFSRDFNYVSGHSYEEIKENNKVLKCINCGWKSWDGGEGWKVK